MFVQFTSYRNLSIENWDDWERRSLSDSYKCNDKEDLKLLMKKVMNFVGQN